MNFVATVGSGNELPSSFDGSIEGLNNGRTNAQTNGATVPELFVINLCASMTPMPAVPKHLKGFEKYKLYQVSRQEDGRRRFRLRLGFFTSETDAEWVLNSVRSLYPAAFTGCVTQEDLRYTNDSPPVAAAPEPKVVATAPVPVNFAAPVTVATSAPAAPKQTVVAQAAPSPPAPTAKPVAAKPVAPATPAARSVAAAPPAQAAPAAKQSLTLSAAEPVAAQPTAPATPSYAQPFHVGRGVELPETNLELTDEYPVPAGLSAHSPSMPAANTNAAKQPAAKPAAAAPATVKANGSGPIRDASVISPPKIVDDYVPILDTTLTIRTLTKTEAEDPNRPKWFAVQLALSEQPINLDTMPKLDIFSAYTLYSVASMEGGTIKHALRLGFFKENVSAEAVMGYLKAFFPTPVLSQISSAEYERFAERKPQPKPVEADANVVKLNDKRPPSATKPVATSSARPAGNPVSKPASGVAPNKARDAKSRVAAPPRPQSFLSRLIGRQLD